MKKYVILSKTAHLVRIDGRTYCNQEFGFDIPVVSEHIVYNMAKRSDKPAICIHCSATRIAEIGRMRK